MSTVTGPACNAVLVVLVDACSHSPDWFHLFKLYSEQTHSSWGILLVTLHYIGIP